MFAMCSVVCGAEDGRNCNLISPSEVEILKDDIGSRFNTARPSNDDGAWPARGGGFLILLQKGFKIQVIGDIITPFLDTGSRCGYRT